MTFSSFPYLSPVSGSEDSESSNESPPTSQDLSQAQAPPDQKMFLENLSCTRDLQHQQSQDLAVMVLGDTEGQSVKQEVIGFDSSVPPPGFVGSSNPR